MLHASPHQSCDADVIIIGAGPAGLAAAYTLARRGQTALILEARDRIGGRVFTLANGIEMGAEFVHGDLPITLGLLREAGLSYTITGGEWIQLRNGIESEAFDNSHWPQLMRRIKDLERDTSLQEVLERYFAEDKYAALKDQAIGYAEGYDTADSSRASAKALYTEWAEPHGDQYRIDRGYSSLMRYLLEVALGAGSRILLSQPVSAISLKNDGVEVEAGETMFSARRVIVALPLGVLQSDAIELSGEGAAPYSEALKALGFGDVIKLILTFREPFWETIYPGLGFLLGSAPVPTWWTQAPRPSNRLTGWLAGRPARTHARMTKEDLIRIAIHSLQQLFSRDDLALLLDDAVVANWSADPYARGSYAYTTVDSEWAQELLLQPWSGRITFAGEYMYNGAAMGTVEAALWSGRNSVLMQG